VSTAASGPPAVRMGSEEMTEDICVLSSKRLAGDQTGQ
jgi:hypothetical protein